MTATDAGRARAEITVLLTVLNDVDDLRDTLAALDRQDREPAEILIVDGGSTDGTLELIHDWSAVHPRTRLLEAPGANISEGRNAGVEAAANEWVACTDAGCIPAAGWLGSFADATEGRDFLAGIWEVAGETPFEACVGIAGHPDPAELADDSRLTRLSHALFGRRYTTQTATGRSMAFTREAWRRAGGFPTELYAGEDVAFSLAVHETGGRPALVPGALVRWRPRQGVWKTARTYASYARGDIRTPARRAHLVRAAGLVLVVAAILLLGVAGLVLAALALAGYLALPLKRARRSPLVWPRYVWMVPLIVALKDLANLAGAVMGIADAALGRRQPRPPGRERDPEG